MEVIQQQQIIVTKHLLIPCPRFYQDVFKTVTVECRDPEHNQSLLNKKTGQGEPNPDLTKHRLDSTNTAITAANNRSMLLL